MEGTTGQITLQVLSFEQMREDGLVLETRLSQVPPLQNPQLTAGSCWSWAEIPGPLAFTSERGKEERSDHVGVGKRRVPRLLRILIFLFFFLRKNIYGCTGSSLQDNEVAERQNVALNTFTLFQVFLVALWAPE